MSVDFKLHIHFFLLVCVKVNRRDSRLIYWSPERLVSVSALSYPGALTVHLLCKPDRVERSELPVQSRLGDEAV